MTKKSEAATETKQATDADAIARLVTPDNVPPSHFGKYRKKVLATAARIAGPFRVVTPQGEVECRDGWLALDESGEPYPIGAEEFEKLYESADQDDEDLGVAVLAMTPAEREQHRMENLAYKTTNTAEDFARAILRNPAAERYLYGNPLDGHRIGNETVGEYMARQCGQLAEDFVRASEKQHGDRMAACQGALEVSATNDATSAA
ncbi:MAG: hypothetical protein RLW61_04595 [Gammaproteobacteria bacterium]